MKANPNYGISVKPDYMRSQAKAAEQRPSFLNSFLRLHLDVWTQQVTRWISVDKWNACNGILQPLETFKGRDAYLGLDLSSKLDLSAMCIAIPDDDIINFFWRFWVPEELVKERARTAKKPDYGQWVKDGWITTTPGSVIDFEFIRQEILASASS
jgi:phage terminase large subunit-like protein